MTQVKLVEIDADEAEQRLDKWFLRHFPALGHARLHKLLRTGQVRVDGHRVQAGLRLKAGQTVRVPPLAPEQAKPAKTADTSAGRGSDEDPRHLRALVLYRDHDMIAINKPAGLAVQGGSGQTKHLDAMLGALAFDAAEPPRLVHRLDRDTSGVLLLARNAQAARFLTRAFRDGAIAKIYWAVVVGVPRPRHGTIDLALAKLPGRGGERMVAADDAGKTAVTRYRVLDHAGDRAAWVELEPLTGRTHQLRAHCAALGVPILGDGKYGGRGAFLPGLESVRGVHLHARTLTVKLPAGGEVTITAPLPAAMRATFRALGFTAPR